MSKILPDFHTTRIYQVEDKTQLRSRMWSEFCTRSSWQCLLLQPTKHRERAEAGHPAAAGRPAAAAAAVACLLLLRAATAVGFDPPSAALAWRGRSHRY